MQKASRAIVILKDPTYRRVLAEAIKPGVRLGAIIERAYWDAWDRGADSVYIYLHRHETRDGERRHFVVPFHRFDVVEGRDDA